MSSIVMLGTQTDTMGGISAVVGVYRDEGFLAHHDVIYLSTHVDGSSLRKLAVMLGALFRFLGLLLLRRVSLVHVHTSSRSSFWRKSLFFLLAFAFRVPTILHLHGSEFAVFHDRECGPIRRRMVRWVFERCARVLVLSSAWRDWVLGMCANPHVQVLYNPVSVPPVRVVPTREAGRLLFLGRLGRRKGTYDLVEAVARIAPSHPRMILCLGGDGEVDALMARARALNVAGQVQALGWVRAAEKRAQFDMAAIYVLPSYHEGLPMSVLEAMASGLPVVSTTAGGIPEAVRDGVEGYLVAPGDIEALADRLQRLLDCPELARQMGEAARVRAETVFSAAAVLPQLAQVWAELGARPATSAAVGESGQVTGTWR